MGSIATARQTIALAGTALSKTEDQFTAPECQLTLIIDGNIVQSGQFHCTGAGELQRIIQVGCAVKGKGLE